MKGSEKKKNRKILAVDDSENVCKMLARILEKERFEVKTACNGQDALEKVYSWLPDLVLLDVQMPVVDGIEACRIIKSNHKYHFIYVIMLTMKTGVEDEVSGFDSGADDYIAKPFHPKTLVARVKRGLSLAGERQSASFDPLTKLYNRRMFELFLKQQTAESMRYDRPFSLVLMDLDHFKKINDVHGHSAGDKVLMQVSGILREHTRNCDLAARWGGEEMAILLPETDLEGAAWMAENLRRTIAEYRFAHAEKVTASFGVAGFSDESDNMFEMADRALYRAKRTGRNKVVAAAADREDIDTR